LLETLVTFSGDDYFKLIGFVDDFYMKKNFPRLSALLQNLEERRDNKWQKHLSVADGPKKLKEIQEDIDKEDDEPAKKSQSSKDKVEQEKLDKKVKEMFEGWEMGKNEEQR